MWEHLNHFRFGFRFRPGFFVRESQPTGLFKLSEELRPAAALDGREAPGYYSLIWHRRTPTACKTIGT